MIKKRLKNPRQKRAIRRPFTRRNPEAPLVPNTTSVDFAPYQAWARENLGFEFSNPSLLVTAFTHRSYVNEHRKNSSAHNERLEFLGDAVLELVATEYLVKHFEQPEGILTSWRAALVRTESIRDAGDRLGYAPLLRMSKGEQQGTQIAKLHIVANAFEALIGAIYLDQGFSAAEKFVEKHILCNIDEIIQHGKWRDAKSRLQEISQREDGEMPEYRVISEIGPDHDKIFLVAVFVRGVEIGRGEGHSKQAAQQNAAEKAIEKYSAQKQ